LLETLPTCQIWQKKIPPLRWTASTMCFHASTCSCVQMPGASGVMIFGISLNLIKEVKDFLFNNFVLSPLVHVRLLSDGCSQDCIAYLILHRLWSTISISSLCRLVGMNSRPWSCLRVHCYKSNCFTSFNMINITSPDKSHVHMLVKNILLSFCIKLYPSLPKYLHVLHRGTSTTLGHFSSCELSVWGVHMLGESRL
jgi:hypothetical protein